LPPGPIANAVPAIVSPISGMRGAKRQIRDVDAENDDTPVSL
jgi:hypothetical protein